MLILMCALASDRRPVPRSVAVQPAARGERAGGRASEGGAFLTQVGVNTLAWQAILRSLGVETIPGVTERTAMARHHSLYDWVEQVVTAFDPHLSRPQATVLALYSFGIVLAQRCGLNSVVMALIPILGCSFLTLRSRLQEFYQPARTKSGRQRQELD